MVVMVEEVEDAEVAVAVAMAAEGKSGTLINPRKCSPQQMLSKNSELILAYSFI